MKFATLLLTLALTTPTLADAVEDVRQAEIAFAKAFADRDKEKFFSMIANDATFLSGLTTARGKQAVVARWSRFFESPQAPFSWGPERVSVSADGKLGLSTGPVFDPKGNHVGDYISTWRKEADGSWKIVFDSNGPGPAVIEKVEEGFVNADDGLKLYYRKTGSGPITMIVPLDSYLHDSFRQFADIATVITYDPRNRGKSGRAQDPKTWTIQQDVRDLEAVRRELKIEKFVPAGYSYLGLMVALYTLDHPSHVTRVVQLGPAPFRTLPDRPQPEAAAAFEAAQKKIEQLRAANASPRELCVAFWDIFKVTMVGNPANAAKFDTSFCELENEWGQNLMPHFAKLFESIDALTVTPEQLQSVKVPVLTIHGTKDRNALYESGVLWASTLPDARLVTVQDAAHNAWLDDPATVFGSIRHFLRGEWPHGATSPPK